LDPQRALLEAERVVTAAPDGAAALLAGCAAAADPDQALKTVADLAQLSPVRAGRLADPGLAGRLTALAGASVELGQWLIRHPEALESLVLEPARRAPELIRADLLRAVGADPDRAQPVAGPGPVDDALRLAYRSQLVRVAARDLTDPDPGQALPDLTGELSDLADATVAAALAIARRDLPDWPDVRLAVIALGKAGAQELNYVSDVDLCYLAEPALDGSGQPACSADQAVELAGRLVARLTQACSAQTAAGSIWPIDANLRPEGAAGPLVRSLASMERYYTRWAHNWEFQAMLKARPMAGDLDLGQAFVDLLAPLVWQAAQREAFVPQAQAMRQRVIQQIPAKQAEREIKLGAGGLRDTEFSVQLLQLVHGRTDLRLRQRGTWPALAALVEFGYIGRVDGAGLDQAYRFQRLLEHRVQLHQLRRSHLMPTDPEGLRRLARSVGLNDPAQVARAWRDSTRVVQRLHRRVFFSPLLEAVARIPTAQVHLTADAAQVRLAALGYGDPAAALRHIEALSAGLTRRAEIQRQLLPAMLGWFADGPNPDLGLLAFRQVSDALGKSPFYLRALRDEGAMAQRLARVLSTSRYASNLLLRDPASVELLAEDRIAPSKDRASLVAEMTTVLGRHEEADSSQALRTVRRRELLRVALADVLGEIDLDAVGRGLSDIADASVEAALATARRRLPQAPQLAVIALGRWGGGEMSYASDADLVFVAPDAVDSEGLALAGQVVSLMRGLLKNPGPDPDLDLDADLRPEGKDGPIVRSLSSYQAYYARWAQTWEAQALIRARCGAGQAELGQAFLEAVDPLRHPVAGLSPTQLVEIRRIKARMESERLPRGVDPRQHLKLGPGGLADVEWTVQLIQLQHAHRLAALRTTNTLEALRAAVQADLVAADDALALSEAWSWASRVRNAIMLLRGKASDVIPNDAGQAGQVGQMLGFERGGASHLSEAWTKLARRARRVVDRLFWDLD
jgi:glutamate-ammonia-ligase adenylyltransferase